MRRVFGTAFSRVPGVAEASEMTELVVFLAKVMTARGNCREISRGRDFNLEETERRLDPASNM
jgi:hypothetical protein